jgi:hypothetical protein
MLQRLFETFYYLNFCCSVVIFLASGSNFRAIFLAMYCSGHGRAPGQSERVSAMSLKRREGGRTSCENHAFSSEPETGEAIGVCVNMTHNNDSSSSASEEDRG